MTGGRGVVLVLAAIAASAFGPALLAAPADEIKALVERQNAAAAYELGKQNPDQIGLPAFDFYFGIAAIDSGHAGEGVLALERYVVNFPENLQARLELARGYFVLGEDARAREEFEGVLKANPPPGVVANIERFMSALRSRESAYQTTTGAFVELGFGHDSNANGGVGSPGINLPIFGSVVVGQNGVKAPTDFTWLAVGGSVSHPIYPGLSLFANGQLDGKYNSNNFASQFDQNNIALNGGLAYVKEQNLYRLTASHSDVEVDHKRFRALDGVSGELHHQLDELQTIGPFIQLARLSYTGDNQPRDADFQALGVNYRKAFIGNYQPLFTATANIGNEHNVRNRPDLGRDMYGGRVALAVTPAPKWGLSVGATYQKSRYQGPDILLLTTRKDDYYALDAVASYAFSRQLSVRGEATLSSNKSNLELYEYQRNIYAVKLRYEF
jgi:hypothetical protein